MGVGITSLTTVVAEALRLTYMRRAMGLLIQSAFSTCVLCSGAYYEPVVKEGRYFEVFGKSVFRQCKTVPK